MKRSMRKRMARGAKKFHAHLRKIVEASDRELNELCEVFQWTEKLTVNRGMSRE